MLEKKTRLAERDREHSFRHAGDVLLGDMDHTHVNEDEQNNVII